MVIVLEYVVLFQLSMSSYLRFNPILSATEGFCFVSDTWEVPFPLDLICLLPFAAWRRSDRIWVCGREILKKKTRNQQKTTQVAITVVQEEGETPHFNKNFIIYIYHINIKLPLHTLQCHQSWAQCELVVVEAPFAFLVVVECMLEQSYLFGPRCVQRSKKENAR
jgi:hypothetical protein